MALAIKRLRQISKHFFNICQKLLVFSENRFKKMANPETAQVISLPLPPAQYVNLYTEENIRKNRAPRPPPPIHETYSMFGNSFNNDDSIIRPLESQGFKRLYPQHCDRRKELKKLNHSLFVNFLDLIDLLIHYPDSPRRTEKIEDLNLLFVHIHHLLNEFRPHQARETLRVMMEMQRRQRLETAQRFQRHLEKVREIVKNTFAALPDNVELDSKLMLPDNLLDSNNESQNGGAGEDGIYPNDRLMCNVIDELL